MHWRPLRYRRRPARRAVRAPGVVAHVTLRLATGEDDEAITRLAALYDRPRPNGLLLLAEVDGQLQAALTLAGDHELMEPYLPTAALVELLALRARHLREQLTPVESATRSESPVQSHDWPVRPARPLCPMCDAAVQAGLLDAPSQSHRSH
jgi:hypothetical protein